MPLILNEFVGFDPRNPKESSSHSKQVILPTQIAEQSHEARPDEMFTVKIEAIHADFGTRNFTRYTLESLQKAAGSWTSPYNAPVIMYHNDYDGQVVGRVLGAEIAASTKMQGQTLLLTASLPDWHTQESVRNGILSTVSIGASARDVRCSICGAQLSEGDFCDHERGETYDGQTCYWDIYDWEAKEVSFVIVPSDKYAGVITYRAKWEGPANGIQPVHESEENGESKPTIPTNMNIKEHHADNAEGKSKLDIKEAEKKIGSLETELKALKGDKAGLQEHVDSLNNEKIKLQESITALKADAEQKELAVTHERELREAAEKRITEMEKEVKVSLAESLSALREKAGLSAIGNLAERSIDSLHDSIADLKAALKESADAKQDEKVKEEKGSVKDTSLKESAETAGTKTGKTVEEPAADEDFDL